MGVRPILCALAVLVAPGFLLRADAAVDYTTQIKPIFVARCVRCHGGLKQKSQLRLDAGSFILKGGKHGAAISPGKSADSLLVHAIEGGTNGAPKMPETGEPLKADEIALIRQWIDQGAKTPADEIIPDGPESHWSFKAPVRPAAPGIDQVKNVPWVRNPIDAFIAIEQEKRGLTPRPQADKLTLLRRVTLDLIGIPPTRTEMKAFLADESSDAYETVVDRLLASPAYGQRWGRHWMDIWRYSDWDGYGKEVRHSQPHIWHWRDWIIDSLNADKPYDQMVREMLAGDEIAPTNPQVVRATGYLARSWSLYNRTGWMDEVVEHTSKGFLGLTFNCAKCHDHMFDPITQKEYFQFRAIFEAYDVRTDPAPDNPDTAADGIARVVDAHADRPTYLFIRGDDRNPDKDHPLGPTVPASLGGKLEVAKVELPPAAYYTGLREDVRKQLLAAADAAIAMQQKELAQHEAEVSKSQSAYASLAAPAAPTGTPAAKTAGDGPQAIKAAARVKSAAQPDDTTAQLLKAAGELWLANENVEISKLKIEVGKAQRSALLAKIEADRARYATPPAPNAEQLALTAGRAERFVAVCNAELEARRAQHELGAAQAAAKGKSGGKTVKTITDAGLMVVQQGAAVAAARAALDKPSAQYAPITTVYPRTSTGRRLALAKWITRRDNPLAARVAVNHIWMRHFGAPIVPTVFDFGLNGRPPTHPLLLDWLAVELMDSGWSMKHIHRLMVTSSAYRMRSDTGDDDASRKADPDNVYYWHANTRRMEAEVVRDSVLAIANNLDMSQNGPDIDHEQGLTNNRRSLYFRHAYEKQMTFLTLFDAPSMFECYRRVQSVMPQQALALANSPLAIAQARRLASILTNESGSGSDPRAAFITRAFEQVLSREPTQAERGVCEQFLDQQSKRLGDPTTLSSFDSGGTPAVMPSSDPNQRAREDLVLVLLNHNDFVTIR